LLMNSGEFVDAGGRVLIQSPASLAVPPHDVSAPPFTVEIGRDG
jgi:hypothetical protein